MIVMIVWDLGSNIKTLKEKVSFWLFLHSAYCFKRKKKHLLGAETILQAWLHWEKEKNN